MRILGLALLLAACAAAPAQAATAELMVVGKKKVLRGAGPVALKAASARVEGRRCRFKRGTPLAALLRTSLKVRLRDYGACSRRVSDGGGVYVRGVNRDVERGRDGWVYKVGRRTPGAGAGDPSARVKGGRQLLWFWCRNGRRGCQRTLAVRPETTSVRRGQALRVTVRGYDDYGRGKRIAGATVRLGAARATTGSDGTAVLRVPSRSGTLDLVATRRNAVRSFPVAVGVR